MQTRININGVVTAPEEARISVLDHGLLFGDSVYETLRTYNGKPFLFSRHFARLERFGLEGFGENAGAFLGPLLTLLLVYALHLDMRTIFYLAAIPAMLAFITVFWVNEDVPPAAKRPHQAQTQGSFRPVIGNISWRSQYSALVILRTLLFFLGPKRLVPR